MRPALFDGQRSALWRRHRCKKQAHSSTPQGQSPRRQDGSYQSGAGTNAPSSPGGSWNRPCCQSPARHASLAASMRFFDDATKFHQMWRGPSIVAPPSSITRSQRVAVIDPHLHQIGDRGEPIMRMRPHVNALPGQKLRRSHLVKEDERPDHLPLQTWQGTAHLKPTQIAGAWDDDSLNRIDSIANRNDRVKRRVPAYISP